MKDALRTIRFVGAVASMVAASACKGSGAAAAADPPPASVDVAQVISRQVTHWDIFNGRVSAVHHVALRARVTGTITKVAYAEGRDVRKGDLLFVIDQRPYRAALESARAQLERAQATERNARRQDERAQALLHITAISREDAEQRRAAHEQSVAELHAARSAMEVAALNLEFTEVRAPVDGRTSRAQVTLGNVAVADQTVLTSVVSQDPVYVEFDLDEQSYLRHRGMMSKTRKDVADPVRVGLANDEGFPYRGQVSFIDNQLEPSIGTIRARAVVRNPDGVFTPGLYARVQFSADRTAMAMLTTDRAILTDQDRKYVYVLGTGNKVLRKDVKTGRKLDGLTVIESGLGPEDMVVVAGLQKIFAPETVVAPRLIALEKGGAELRSSR